MFLAACGGSPAASNSPAGNIAGQSAGIQVQNAYTIVTPAGSNAAVYFTIQNDTGQADVLVGASGDIAEAVEMHESVPATVGTDMQSTDNGVLSGGDPEAMGMAAEPTATEIAGYGNSDYGYSDTGGNSSSDASGMDMSGDVMIMQPVDSIDLAAGGQVTFEPGGYHVMLINLNRDLSAGDTFTITLHFQNADDLPVTVTVQAQ